VGYVPVHNRNASDGLWKIGGRRQAVYGRAMVVSREADNNSPNWPALRCTCGRAMVVSREVGAAGGHHANCRDSCGQRHAKRGSFFALGKARATH
jgi:hypothetical protein